MSLSHPTPAEQHLGDRLAALVDGELGHDARERVLAHLATCPRCKAEADAQRRLKNVFAAAAPPPPSESFLARLQGLPGDDGDPDPYGPGGGGLGGTGVFTLNADHPLNPLKPRPRTQLPYASGEPHTPALPDGEHGFRIHDVGRQEADRSASRGRRFAFAAAGAVSLAAIALGGVATGVPTTAGGPAQSGPPSNATPMRSTGPATAAEEGRRRAAGQSTTRSTRPGDGLPGAGLSAPATPVAALAPLLSGVPTPLSSPDAAASLPAVAPSIAAPLPLIRPLPTASYAPELSTSPSHGAVDPNGSILDMAPKPGVPVHLGH